MVARNCAINYQQRTIVQTTTRVRWGHSFAPSPLTFKSIIMLSEIQNLEAQINTLKEVLETITKEEVKKDILEMIESREHTIKMLRMQD